MRIKAKIINFTILFFMLLMFACSQITENNYNKLKIGMSYREVVSILGKPKKKTEIFDKVQYTWQDKEKIIKILFKDHFLVSYSKKGF